MPSIVKQTLPDGVSLEIPDAATVEMNVDADLPSGKIAQTHYVEGAQVHTLGVWESESDYRAFSEQRLWSAMAKVAGQPGVRSNGPLPAGLRTAGATMGVPSRPPADLARSSGRQLAPFVAAVIGGVRATAAPSRPSVVDACDCVQRSPHGLRAGP